MRILLVLPLLAACDAGHLGNPLTLPVRAVASGIEKAHYDARRDKVSGYLRGNQLVLSASDPASEHWVTLFALAGTPAAHHARVVQEVRALNAGGDWVERATVIVMVYS